jgi:hypothetical protein
MFFEDLDIVQKIQFNFQNHVWFEKTNESGCYYISTCLIQFTIELGYGDYPSMSVY